MAGQGALCGKLTVDGVVAVVGAAAVAEGRFADEPARVAEQRLADSSLDHDNPLEEVYEDQLMSADLVVLNKADLVDNEPRRVCRRLQDLEKVEQWQARRQTGFQPRCALVRFGWFLSM
jgi:G3E family GTPase